MRSRTMQFVSRKSFLTARRLRGSSFLLAFAVALLGTAQSAEAVSPPPDGGYAGNNTAEGGNALFSLTSGTSNSALGYKALFSNTTGFDNTATGAGALRDNQTGQGNTATGVNALLHNTTGSFNTAVGDIALTNNTDGNFNTAMGVGALGENKTGDSNTAIGWSALGASTGNHNTALGTAALFDNKTGGGNTAVGDVALQNNVSGSFNTATGIQALNDNVTGFWNTAYGYQALMNNTGGSFNIAVGVSAGVNLTAGSSNIYIGNFGIAREDKTIRIGTQGTQLATFIAGISGVAVTGPAIHVSNNGQLGIVPSSARYKESIEPMAQTSEAVLKLKPVTFHYKEKLDPDRSPQFGLVAEEVEKVDPTLVVHDEQGKPFTVRYEAVNAMLLNEFLKEHRRVEQLEVNALVQLKEIRALAATVKKQASQIQKVSAELELNESALRTAANNQ